MKHKKLILISLGIVLFVCFVCFSCLTIYKFVFDGRYLPEEVGFTLNEYEFTKIASDCLADKSIEHDCYSRSGIEYGHSYSQYYSSFALKYSISGIYKSSDASNPTVVFSFNKSNFFKKAPDISLTYVTNKIDNVEYSDCNRARLIRNNWIYREVPFGCFG